MSYVFPDRIQPTRFDAVNITNKVYVKAGSVYGTPLQPPKVPEPDFQPKTGDYFMIAFKNGDRSWQEQIFICCNADDRIVVGMFLSSSYGSFGPKAFHRKDVTFYKASSALAMLLVRGAIS